MSGATDPTREEIFAALFACASGVSWGGGQTFAETGRRLKLYGDAQVKPALYQTEYGETFAQATRMPYKRTFTAWWFAYFESKDEDAIPAQTANQILDALEAALAPAPTDPGFPEPRNTLGGLVYHCFIDGKALKNPGDLDGQGVIIVPITILAP